MLMISAHEFVCVCVYLKMYCSIHILNEIILFFFSLSNFSVNIASEQDHRRSVYAPFKTTKMNIEKVPLVTALLRASRSQDETVLRQVLENILRNGINEGELNAADCSGRVSGAVIQFLLYINSCTVFA